MGTGPIGLALALDGLIIKKISVLTPVDYEGFVWLMVWQSIVYVPAPGRPWQGDPGSGAGMRGRRAESVD